ncbi:ATP-dependent RNA helicase BRR2 Ecym_3516 [Eremothecium cymbalariae DBVPG|uniref:RNA helicase n=1 Tax=Eremothecium cymbalariae (strain CBS 270.75 / DBVPG 7215 / KCTC 17166 / NRRL Y-17582) TaxID=931890 RepID=G8JQL0_ERECY|nr:Hypothetical protein Ecym_3516 [Eremothecium cymbalariae DBVPG\
MSEEKKNEIKQKIREIYRYDGMSNKVLRADRRLQENKADPLKDAAIAQPKSMAGRISIKDMGQITTNEDSNIAEKPMIKELPVAKVKKEAATTTATRNIGLRSVLADGIDTLKYYPSTKPNTEVYGNILAYVSELLGNDMPHSVVVSATDLVLQVLKGDGLESEHSMTVKKQQIEEDLDMNLGENKFHELVNLSKKLTDYHRNTEPEAGNEVAIIDDSGSEDDDDDEDNEATTNQVLEDLGEGMNIELIDTNDQKTNDIKLGISNDIIEFHGSTKNDAVEHIPIYVIDEYYLQRKINSVLKVSDDLVHNISEKILQLLGEEYATKDLESKLIEILKFENYELIEFIVLNRMPLFWGTKLSRVSEKTRESVLEEMLKNGHYSLVEEYKKREVQPKRRVSDSSNEKSLKPAMKKQKNDFTSNYLQIVDLNTLSFDPGSKLLTTTRISLPKDSFKRIKPSYEEIHIPAPLMPTDGFPLVPISQFPEWAQKAFPVTETKTLNRIQSEVYPVVFDTDVNILLCAPTGAGKTNVAILAILRAISKFFNVERNKLQISKFKVVYVAPLKALVQEQVREFQRRLQQYGIRTAELTGDSNLTKQQISDTQILVSTPEKWDVITRNESNQSFIKYVRLIIIDEIHLLHDERGPVLESIVARSFRNQDLESIPRLLGLSATLPNFEDVAKFLRVPKEGLFYFDSSYRPCPLAQQFCGITEKSAIKKVNAMNHICYEKILESVAEGHQVIVFVHSRKDTSRTARWIKEKLVEEENINRFIPSDPGAVQILKRESKNISDRHLCELVEFGIGVHHAGLMKDDRSLSEDLFADGLLKVLVSTATLAWGVNLPAHTVIIKGTDVYSPEKGEWTHISPQDVLQMLGRAGRPRYDTNGEGIIITNQSDIQYYLAVLNQQLPIESQFISRFVDNLNAEIVLGSVKNRLDAVDWLGYTYLYVRLLKVPDIYNVPVEKYPEDTVLYNYRCNLAHSALTILHNNNLVVYDALSGNVRSTELGRIASRFYIKYTTISMYNESLGEQLDQLDILNIFAKSDEFKYMSCRQEEKHEITRLLERAPIPIKENADDPLAKVNILLQSYISRLVLDGFALNADMVFITQNAGRLFRALFEICLRKRWPRLTKILLNICRSIDRRLWLTNSPLRQFPRCPIEIIKKTEASSLPWIGYLYLKSPAEVAQAIRSEKFGKATYDLIQRFPKLRMECSIQPITQSVLKFSLELIPEWIWDSKIHGHAETFILTVEDTDGEVILYTDTITIMKDYSHTEHLIEFTIQLDLSKPVQVPPAYFISLSSEKWLHADYRIPVVLNEIHLPKKFPAPTQLIERDLIPINEVGEDEYMNTFPFSHFNKFQTHVFHPLYNTEDNVLICACKGSGKTVMAELALLNHWKNGKGRAVYICPSQERIDGLLEKWKHNFSNIAGGKNINKFGAELTLNLRLLTESHLILSTPSQFDLISRRWKRRRNIQTLELLILDDVHMVSNGLEGAIYETIISRMLFIRGQLETNLRTVGLSTSLADGRNFGEWIGANKNNIFNFSYQERNSPFQIQFQSYEDSNKVSVDPSMLKSAFELIINTPAHLNTVVFLSARKLCIDVGITFTKIANSINKSLSKMNASELDNYLIKVKDLQLKEFLKKGIGFFYKGMYASDKNIVEELHNKRLLSVTLSSRDFHNQAPISNNVIILSTQYYDIREHRNVNYTIIELLEMLGLSTGYSNNPGRAIILTNSKTKDYYKKFLTEPLPTESYMPFYLHDGFITDIATSIIESKQDCVDWITYTYFYRRIHANPSYYGVKDTSPMGISAYFTEVVQDTLDDLLEASVIEINHSVDEDQQQEADEVISPLNGCMISSHYNISFQTMYMFMNSLEKSTKLKSIIETLASALEFENIQFRQEEFTTLSKIHSALPFQYSAGLQQELPAFKVFVLLQAHFSRLKLPAELEMDLNSILGKVIPLLNGIIDILSGDGRLNVTTAIDLSQMLVQGCWDTDSPLKQIPYFDSEILQKCADHKVETVYDIMALEDEERNSIISLPAIKLNHVAEFVNSYPNIELQYSIDKSASMIANKPKSINVTIVRDEEPESLIVISSRFPVQKLENWWIFIGEISTKQLYAIRKVSLTKETQSYDLDVTISEVGKHRLTLWCVCDSYMDADKELSFDLDVIE